MEDWEVVGKAKVTRLSLKKTEQLTSSAKRLNKKFSSPPKQPGILNLKVQSKIGDKNTKNNQIIPITPKPLYKAPKKTTSVALFDLVVLTAPKHGTKENAQSSKVSNEIDSSSNQVLQSSKQIKQLQSSNNASEDLKPKSFIANKKKKKGMSTVKKRILMERLQTHKVDNIDEIANIEKLPPSDYKTIKIFDFFTVDEVNDVDERQEVMNNVKELLAPFGTITTIELITPSTSTSILSSSNESTGSKDYVLAKFTSSSDAFSAYWSLHGMIFGGQPIAVTICQDSNLSNVYSYQPKKRHANMTIIQPIHDASFDPSLPTITAADFHSHNPSYVTPAPGSPSLKTPLSSPSKSAVDNTTDTTLTNTSIHPSTTIIYNHEPVALYIENMVFDEDVSDPEEAIELLTDLQTFCTEFTSGITALWIEKRRPIDAFQHQLQQQYNGRYTHGLGDHSSVTYQYLPSSSSATTISQSPSQPLQQQHQSLPWLFVEFNQLSVAIECSNQLSGKIMNDNINRLSIQLYDYTAYLSGFFHDAYQVDMVSKSQRRKSIAAAAAQTTGSSPQRRKSTSISPTKRRKSVINNSNNNSNNTDDNESNNNTTSSASGDKKIVFGVILRDFVEKEQVEDVAERDDIILDINRVFFQTSDNSAMEVSADVTTEITFWENIAVTVLQHNHSNTNNSGSNNEESSVRVNNNNSTSSSSFLNVLITFPSLLECCTAVSRLKDKIIAGSSVTADIVSVNARLAHWQKTVPIGKELPCQMINRSGAAGAVLLVKGLTVANSSSSNSSSSSGSSIDIEDSIKMKSAFLALYRESLSSGSSSSSTTTTSASSGSNSSMPSISSSYISRISVYNGELSSSSSSSSIVACVGFARAALAEEAMVKLDGSVVGGHSMRVYVSKPHKHSSYHRNYNEDDEYEDLVGDLNIHDDDDDDDEYNIDNTPINSARSIGSAKTSARLSTAGISYNTKGKTIIAKRNMSVTGGTNNALSGFANTSPENAKKMMSQSFRHDSSMIKRLAETRTTNNSTKPPPLYEVESSASVVAITKSRNTSKTKTKSTKNPSSSSSSLSQSGGRHQSKYSEAKDMPKLDKQTTLQRNVPVASEDMNDTVKQLLHLLNEYQERAAQKDPIKAKQKLRYVAGLKQVSNGVKSGRAKLVLLTPDTEASTVLDERIMEIINDASQRSIPVIYCLSRRKLGKALNMSTKQTVVAIYDASGAQAHDFYMKIVRFVEEFHINLNISLSIPNSSSSSSSASGGALFLSPRGNGVLEKIPSAHSVKVVTGMNSPLNHAIMNALLDDDDDDNEKKNHNNNNDDDDESKFRTVNLTSVSTNANDTATTTATTTYNNTAANRTTPDKSTIMNTHTAATGAGASSRMSDGSTATTTTSSKRISHGSVSGSGASANSGVSFDDIEDIQYVDDEDEYDSKKSMRLSYPSESNGLDGGGGGNGSARTSSRISPRLAAANGIASRRGSGGSYNVCDRTIVIDNGSHNMRAGFSGEDFPLSIFPSAVAMASFYVSPQSERKLSYYVGQKATGQPAVNHPYHGGAVQSWDEMEAMWEYCFTDCLHADTTSSKVFLTETHHPPNHARETTIETMFELFEVQSAYLHVQPVLALFAAGLTSGCVVESGEYSTTVYPVADGFHLINASTKLSFGGHHITKVLEKLITNKCHSNATQAQVFKNHKNNVIRNIKEKLCYIHSADTTNTTTTKTYDLPDGTTIELGNDILSESTEGFFDPSRFADVYNYDEISLPIAMLNSIMAASMDLRRSLAGSIVLTGGNTMFAGLNERLTNELKKVLPGSMSTSLRIIDPPDKCNAIWSGGSILTSLSTFDDQWITEDDYYEYGPEIVHKKCSVYL